MRRTSNFPKRRTPVARTGLATLLAVLLVTLAACGDTASEQTTPSTNSPDSVQVGDSNDVVINVELKEFGFTPDTLRIPAGQAVKLVLENVGLVPHEFMAGRDVASDESAFNEDLFAGVDVEGSMDMDMDMEDMNHEGVDEVPERGEEAAENGHGDDDHGTMLLLEGKAAGSMRFTLPESKRGTWAIGCFLPGHYQAGMKGILIIE
ncbi:MAG: hypothetical protein BMS9Abin05_2461 [Rhodothermia bacterium]|nr:MAG: hypothetical protein BMS9Abin05_2461 [Rhodothermia bacterium]